MNLLSIIREKSQTFPPTFQTAGIEAVILHIERAESYWERAKHEADEVLFTDVIYRTNQAFEGILKEAYLVLAGKNVCTKPHKIEEYLAKGNLFRERVLAAFTNYRTEWRNKSTHDYKLFFSEQEALLAINSVSAFCVILLEQIITKANERHERERAQQLSATVKSRIKGFSSLDLHQKISALLTQSYEFMEVPKDRPVLEYEFIGFLSGFVEAVDSSIKAEAEVLLDPHSRERANLVFTDNHDTVIVEVRRYSPVREIGQDAHRQLLHYLQLSSTKYGILMTVDEKATKGDSRTLKSLADNSPIITFIKPIDA